MAEILTLRVFLARTTLFAVLLPAAKGKEEMAAEEERLQEEVVAEKAEAMVELGESENGS